MTRYGAERETNTMTRDAKKAVRQEAIDRLREWIKPGDTVHTLLKSVSRSGMSRVIQVVKIQCRYDVDECGENTEAVPEILYLGYNVAEACNFRYDREREGVKIGGCGMDMGFAIVYDLGRVLYGSGFGCIGEGCPSNDHSNGDRDYRPHVDDCPQDSSEVGTDIPRLRSYRHWHKDGGYSLKQRWL